MFDKMIKGSDRNDRSTRFHDENDVFMGWTEFRHLPYTLWTTGQRKLIGKLPILPWWPYPAIRAVGNLLSHESTVLEFGIGMSTLWLAQRAGKVIGIEGAPEWYEMMSENINQDRLENVTLFLRDSTKYRDRGNFSDVFNEAFSSLDGIPNTTFDLVVVDGAARWKCVENALPVLSSGGCLYLDNSDADKDWAHYTTSNMIREAQKRLLEAEKTGFGTIEYYRGLAPATMTATEGMLFRRNPQTRA